MPFKFLTISIRDDGTAADELNSFLQSPRILAVIPGGLIKGPVHWSICVDYDP